MTQPGPKTSWEDLAHLGWSQQQVYDTLNPLHNYTMHGLGNLHLNDDITSNFPTYNVTSGHPYCYAKLPDHQVPEMLIPVAKFDNRDGSLPLIITWTDKWFTKLTVTLELTRDPSINLKWSVTIELVADSGFAISMSDNTITQTIEEESMDSLEEKFELTVPPGEILEVHDYTTFKPTCLFKLKFSPQRYGPDGDIVTMGDEYDESIGLSYNMKVVLNSPSSDIVFIGLSQRSTFSHDFIHHKGKTQKALNSVVKVAKAISTTKSVDGQKTAFEHPIPVAIEKSIDSPK
ncbi:hypothetical protein IW262DRAFT_1530824 [Armillaria fumosa]|nr:hypothetical protein IW262DRAFT_1530824 [Armillaria fumosa]